MKNSIILAFIFCCSLACNIPTRGQVVVHSDVTRFWKAYDLIQSTDDSLKQLKILEDEYIRKGTEGLRAIMEKKRWTGASYIEAIREYPSFWESVRQNTLQSKRFANDINVHIEQLRNLYPELKHAQVFFTIGVLGTNGTAHDGHVLIGAELALADSTVVTSDIHPERLRENLHSYFHSNPINDVVLLNVHEYVHTQQGKYGTDLLSMSIYEGVAEFVSVIASGKPSVTPAIRFGKMHAEEVKSRFQKEMFSPNWNDWLYNDTHNEFSTRDLGYYVGYRICEEYYQKALNKKKALKEMIELDCSDPAAVYKFVMMSGYFTESYVALEKSYIEAKPKVVSVAELQGKIKLNASETTQLTIQFSQTMNDRFYNFKIGGLGRDHVLPVTSLDWSNDKKTVILGVDLEKNMRYQLIVSSEFRDSEGRALDNYLIDFQTE